jgi:SAM-dependent methyltransferase
VAVAAYYYSQPASSPLVVPSLSDQKYFEDSIGFTLFAMVYVPFLKMMHAGKNVKELKIELLKGVKGNVLEIGAGPGANFEFLPKNTISSFTALEPNKKFHEALIAGAKNNSINIKVVEHTAEYIEMNEKFDCVISTLVLCSVNDVPKVLEIVKKVLKPGGTFHFMEHIGSQPGSLGRFTQRLLRDFWYTSMGGCFLDRDTDDAIAAAGFSSVQFIPTDDVVFKLPLIAGVAKL